MPEFSISHIRESLPELPWERSARYVKNYALKKSDVAYLCSTQERALFFDGVARALDHNNDLIALAVNYIVSDLAGISAKKGSEVHVTSETFAKFVRLIHEGIISSRGAKDLLVLLVESEGDPETVAKEHGLIQIHDSTMLSAVVDTVLKAEQKAVTEYKSGKQAALQYLVGKAMKESRGAGNPSQLRELIVDKIS